MTIVQVTYDARFADGLSGGLRDDLREHCDDLDDIDPHAISIEKIEASLQDGEVVVTLDLAGEQLAKFNDRD